MDSNNPNNMQNQMGPNGPMNQNGPIGSNGSMNQPMQPGMGPNMNPNMGPIGPYPQPQPMMRPPKQPMDPAKKKKIIIIISIISALVVVGVALAIILPIVLRVDYAGAYKTAKELKPYIYDIDSNYDCEYVVDYVKSTYTTEKTYSGYIDGCKEAFDSKTNELVNQLENTDGVKRNEEIKTQFAKFKNEYDKLSIGNIDELDYKLSLWQSWHNFELAIDNLSTPSFRGNSDAEITKAANYLINSNNDILKTYGEGWLEYSLAVAAAYRAYDNASWSDSNYEELRDAYNNKKAESQNWRDTNRPDISVVAPLDFGNTSKMYSEYTTLYRLIADTYAINYNSGSGDCTEILGEVYCD